MTFEMMFCRTDILDELGLEPPKTWDEMIKLVYPVVSRNNMEIGIGNLTKVATMNASNIFTNLLYQKGGSVYNEELTASALDTPVALEAFPRRPRCTAITYSPRNTATSTVSVRVRCPF